MIAEHFESLYKMSVFSAKNGKRMSDAKSQTLGSGKDRNVWEGFRSSNVHNSCKCITIKM